MDHGFPDRRRFPRVEATDDVMVGRPVAMAVQMLDLSSGGLLLACPRPVRLGARLQVTAQIAGRRLDADLDVRHASSQWDHQIKGYRIGGCFVSLDPIVRCAIDNLFREGAS